MIDVAGIGAAVVAATVLLDERPRAALIATAVWLVAAALLATHHGVAPGIVYALAAVTAALSIAIVVAPVAPRAIRMARIAAAAIALAAALTGVLHG